jgi:PAS domain S-box-containing protein
MDSVEHKSLSEKLQQANKDLAFYIEQNEKRAAELLIANKELVFQNHEKENRAAELVLLNNELVFQNHEKENRAAELIIANKELAFQNREKESRAAELVIANKELVFQMEEKKNRAAELVIANKELVFQNEEKKNRAAELVIANSELVYQNQEKENRAAELILANKELLFQNQEKEERAAELMVINKELVSRTKALFESEALFRNMMETISQMAWTVTAKAKASFFNQQWCKYTGFNHEQAKVQGWDIITHPDDLQHSSKPLLLIQGGSRSEWTGEVRFKRADGIFRWHLVSILPIINEYEEVQLWIGTATDIHDLKILQEQKDDFISIASHEIKTPLTSLTASFQLLNRMKENPSPEVFSPLIERANKNLDKLNLLIKNLLNVSQFNQGQLHLYKKWISIGELIENSCQSIRLEDVFTIEVEGDDQLEIFADPERIEQVLVNLVNNSMKYAPHSKEIQVRIEKIESIVKISVIDKGEGIEANKLPYLFDRYYRADSNGCQFSGLGLGLYISGEIIRKHEGQIGVDSELGKGSTFWFILPVIVKGQV